MVWDLFQRHADDRYEMVGVDSELWEAAPIRRLPVACEIRIGTPSALPEALAATETAIGEVIARLGGRIAATTRSESELWTLVYLPSDEHAARLSELPLPSQSTITVAPTIDPGWTIFDRVRPTGMEEQSRLDTRVLADLYESGDRGGVRPIEHVVTGLTEEALDEFAAAAENLYPTIHTEGSAGSTLTAVVVHDGEPSDVTPDAWTIRLIAERLDATYDGWRCAVVRPPSRHRWFG